MKGKQSCSFSPLVLVVCNALDDNTRQERRIYTDSPAASRKVFMMCQALKKAGIRPVILSLGRGRADASGDFFSTKVCRVRGVTTIYAPFSHVRGFSELLSLFGLLSFLLRLSRHLHKAVIFYNRMPAYLPALHLASRLGYRCILDLEDGEVYASPPMKEQLAALVTKQFERHCRHGALLACSALSTMTTVRPLHCYYGTTESSDDTLRWNSSDIVCLMSGTLSPETGVPLLIEAIRHLRVRMPDWAGKLCFEVTGKGDSLAELESLAAEPGLPRVRVHGRVSDSHYREIMQRCNVGLALKPVGGKLADTTFPSKVIEFASSGLLVLSTDISDVRRLLGDGARYLEYDNSELLIERLGEIATDKNAAALTAEQGRQAAVLHCAPDHAGNELRHFIFGERT